MVRTNPDEWIHERAQTRTLARTQTRSLKETFKNLLLLINKNNHSNYFFSKSIDKYMYRGYSPHKTGRTDARSYTEMMLIQLCLAHRKLARENKVEEYKDS